MLSAHFSVRAGTDHRFFGLPDAHRRFLGGRLSSRGVGIREIVSSTTSRSLSCVSFRPAGRLL